MYRHHAHMLKHMCAWCRYTRGRFECTNGVRFERATPHRTTHTHHDHSHNDTHHRHHHRHTPQTQRDTHTHHRHTATDTTRRQRQSLPFTPRLFSTTLTFRADVATIMRVMVSPVVLLRLFPISHHFDIQSTARESHCVNTISNHRGRR